MVQVEDSKSLVKYGEQHLSKPGPRSSMQKRKFSDLKPKVVETRRDTARAVKTLAGITRKFEIVCLPDGAVMWRRY